MQGARPGTQQQHAAAPDALAPRRSSRTADARARPGALVPPGSLPREPKAHTCRPLLRPGAWCLRRGLALAQRRTDGARGIRAQDLSPKVALQQLSTTRTSGPQAIARRAQALIITQREAPAEEARLPRARRAAREQPQRTTMSIGRPAARQQQEQADTTTAATTWAGSTLAQQGTGRSTGAAQASPRAAMLRNTRALGPRLPPARRRSTLTAPRSP